MATVEPCIHGNMPATCPACNVGKAVAWDARQDALSDITAARAAADAAAGGAAGRSESEAGMTYTPDIAALEEELDAARLLHAEACHARDVAEGRAETLAGLLDRASAFVTTSDLRAEIDGALLDKRKAALHTKELKDNG